MYFKAARGSSLIYIVLLGILAHIFTGILSHIINSYVLLILLRVGWIGLSTYFLYYLLLNISLKYKIDNKYITITYFGGIKLINIAFEDIEGYELYEGSIHGLKLSGIGNDKFSFGKNIIDKIGTTQMFVTSNRKILYIKTPYISYGVSPSDFEGMKDILDKKNIKNSIDTVSVKKNVDLHKDKRFIIPFILVTIIIVILTLNPFLLYINQMLPEKMPLSFDAAFKPIQTGSGKQFAFKQMTYGVLNMMILLCMYYAAYFCAKYDKISAYRYLYVALITSLTFLILQIRILYIFN